MSPEYPYCPFQELSRLRWWDCADSGIIRSVAYDPQGDGSGVLYIGLSSNDRVYAYEVTDGERLLISLLTAKSAGVFFNKHVRNKFPTHVLILSVESLRTKQKGGE